MTPELIVSIWAGVIALFFGYFPILRTKFAALTSEAKSLIMLGLMALVGFGVWGAGCIGWMDTGMACTSAAIPALLKYIFLAIITSQGVNRIAPELPDVKEAKTSRDMAAYDGDTLSRFVG
jgi:hypothetical protein